HRARAGAAHGRPLKAELARLVHADFCDQRFDKHLRAPHVELFDDGAQVVINGVRRVDDERVGRLVGLHERSFSAPARRTDGTRRAWHGRRRRRLLRARFARQQPAQHFREFHRLGVAQVNDACLSAGGRLYVELGDQRLQLREAARVLGTNEQAVGAQIGNNGETIARRHTAGLDGYAARRARGRARRHRETRDEIGDVEGGGVLQRHDRDFACGRLIDAVDNREQAANVVGEIRDDERVRGVISRELARGRHEWTQYRYDLTGGNVLQYGDVRRHLLTAARHVFMHVRALLGLCNGNDPHQPAGALDGGEALGLERREKNLIRRRSRHRFRGDDRDLALYPRVEQKVPIGHLRNGFHHRLDIRRLEVEQHFVAAHLGYGRSR